MIYPILQSYTHNDEKIEINSINFTGCELNTASNIAKQYSVPQGDEYNIEIRLSKDILINIESDEKYYINICEKTSLVLAFSKRAVFRAIHTIMKLINSNEYYLGEIEDYPLFKTRGYIEGFYGPTWEHSKRLSVMQLMAKYGMNTFYYAPKDDIYHREKWRDLYPDEEYGNLSALFKYATDNEFDFYWCVGPGLTYHYSSKDDFTTLINKIKSVYNLGIRNFGLLLDDIPSEFQYEDDKHNFGCITQAHIKLVNDLYTSLKSIDSSIQLTVCPTEYFGNEYGDYISVFGKGIFNDIKIFWTGQEICSRVLTCRECNDFINSTTHKPLFWDNYPVNDCEMFNEMHLGAIIGRDKELYKYCDGLISNVMQYAECSKIPLITIADYLWNPISYSHVTSLKNAHKEILDEKAELFKYISDHLCFSCLNRNGGSQLMSDKLSKISFLKSTGKDKDAINEFADYITKMKKCLEMLQDTSVELFNEMKKWIEKFEMCCDLLQMIYDTQISPTKENKEKLAYLLEKYNRDAVIMTGFCLREATEKTLKHFN